MRILINSATVKMGGGLTYIENLIRGLGEQSLENEYLFLLPADWHDDFPVPSKNIKILKTDIGRKNLFRQFFWQQISLRKIIREEKIDALFSVTNFAAFFCPCPQLLLIRNSLYFSPIYLNKILPKKSLIFRIEFFLRRFLLLLSIKSVDKVMAPSESLKDEIMTAFGISKGKIIVNNYGIDFNAFQPASFGARGDTIKLLFLSHYGDYKNFTTLFRALILLKERGVSNFRLITPANLFHQLAREHISLKADLNLVSDSRIKDHLVFRKDLPHSEAPKLYRESDIFIWPSLAESFGHPLVEAMASGLPIVASDIPINHEICRDAAIYFEPLKPEDLADKIRMLMENSGLRRKLIEAGQKRVQNFRWEDHVRRLLDVFDRISQK